MRGALRCAVEMVECCVFVVPIPLCAGRTAAVIVISRMGCMCLCRKDSSQTHVKGVVPSDRPREPVVKSQVHLKTGENVYPNVVGLYHP